MSIPVPQGTKSRFVTCEIKKTHLKVGLRGQPLIIDVSVYVTGHFSRQCYIEKLFLDYLLVRSSLLGALTFLLLTPFQGDLYQPVKAEDCFWSIGMFL